MTDTLENMTGGIIDGARGRNRTGMVLPPRDFLTRYNFRCCTQRVHLWSGLSLCHITNKRDTGRSRQVSTLSRKSSPGLARDCHHPEVLRVPRI